MKIVRKLDSQIMKILSQARQCLNCAESMV
jgi:hypothetical protein